MDEKKYEPQYMLPEWVIKKLNEKRMSTRVLANWLNTKTNVFIMKSLGINKAKLDLLKEIYKKKHLNHED